MASRARRSISRCNPTMASRASSGRVLVLRTWGSPNCEYMMPRCRRSSSISNSDRRSGASVFSRSVMVTPRAAARAVSNDSLGSRRPFSTSDSWLGTTPTASPSCSKVKPAADRKWRMRLPSTSRLDSISLPYAKKSEYFHLSGGRPSLHEGNNRITKKYSSLIFRITSWIAPKKRQRRLT
jgi:hypothetical protein